MNLWNARAEYAQLAPGATTRVELEVAPTGQAVSGVVLESTASVASDDDDYDLTSNRTSTLTTACNTTLTPATANVLRGGATIDVTVNACGSWIAVNEVPWIIVRSGTPGLDTGVVRLEVAANLSGQPRNGAVLIAGVRFEVTQAGNNCTASLSSTGDASVPSEGKKSTVQLTTTCGIWSASSSAPWLQPYPLSGTGSQAVEYNAFPNFKSATRTATITISGLPFAVTQASATGTNDERLVRFVYFNFLGRFPSSSELASQLAELQRVSRAELIARFFNSDEFNQGGRFIAGLYVGVLDRDAEHSGWLFQRDALARGDVTQLNLVENFINSAEYKLKFPPTSPRNFVKQLYRYILLREASDSEADFHVSTSLTPDNLAARIRLANLFLNTREFRDGTGSRLTAFVLHATLLQRDPTPAERTSVRTELEAGTPVIEIIRRIIATQEFRDQLN